MLKKDGQTADGTFIPNSSVVAKSLSGGHTYYGRAFVVNDWYISERTVVGHKSNMLAKTGCKSAIGLLAYALRNKLIII